MNQNQQIILCVFLLCRWPGRRCRGRSGQRSSRHQQQQQQQLRLQHQEELQPGGSLQLPEPAPPARRQRQKHGQLFPEGRGRADCGPGQMSPRSKRRDSDSKLSDKLFWAVYKLPATTALHFQPPRSQMDSECHRWCVVNVPFISAASFLPFPFWRTSHLRTLLSEEQRALVCWEC